MQVIDHTQAVELRQNRKMTRRTVVVPSNAVAKRTQSTAVRLSRKLGITAPTIVRPSSIAYNQKKMIEKIRNPKPTLPAASQLKKIDRDMHANPRSVRSPQ